MEDGSRVDLTISAGKLVIDPAEPAVTLQALVDRITEENRHEAVTGYGSH